MQCRLEPKKHTHNPIDSGRFMNPHAAPSTTLWQASASCIPLWYQLQLYMSSRGQEFEIPKVNPTPATITVCVLPCPDQSMWEVLKMWNSQFGTAVPTNATKCAFANNLEERLILALVQIENCHKMQCCPYSTVASMSGTLEGDQLGYIIWRM